MQNIQYLKGFVGSATLDLKNKVKAKTQDYLHYHKNSTGRAPPKTYKNARRDPKRNGELCITYKKIT